MLAALYRGSAKAESFGCACVPRGDRIAQRHELVGTPPSPQKLQAKQIILAPMRLHLDHAAQAFRAKDVTWPVVGHGDAAAVGMLLTPVAA